MVFIVFLFAIVCFLIAGMLWDNGLQGNAIQVFGSGMIFSIAYGAALLAQMIQ